MSAPICSNRSFPLISASSVMLKRSLLLLLLLLLEMMPMMMMWMLVQLKMSLGDSAPDAKLKAASDVRVGSLRPDLGQYGRRVSYRQHGGLSGKTLGHTDCGFEPAVCFSLGKIIPLSNLAPCSECAGKKTAVV